MFFWDIGTKVRASLTVKPSFHNTGRGRTVIDTLALLSHKFFITVFHTAFLVMKNILMLV